MKKLKELEKKYNSIKAVFRKREVAAISLLCAIIIPALAALAYASIGYSERAIVEYDASRFVKSAGHVIQSSFSRGLWDEFGLYGISEEEVNLDPIEDAFSTLPNIVDDECEWTLKDNLFETSELKEQILEYMVLRAPIIIAKEIVERISSASKARRNLLNGNALLTLQSGHRNKESHKNYEKGKEGIKLLEEVKEAETIKPHDSLEIEDDSNVTSPEITEEGEELIDIESGLELLSPFLRSFSKKMLPVHEALGNGSVDVNEIYNPSTIERLAGKLDEILDNTVSPSNASLFLGEYALLFFPAKVNIERRLRGHYDLHTPDGRSLDELSESRPLELEQIVSGKVDKKTAERYCKHLIIGLRFIPRYVEASNKPSYQRKYRTWGNILSKVLLVASLGQVKIEGQVLAYFVQCVHCLYQADKDYDQLAKGYGLYFWPAKSKSIYSGEFTEISFYYRDYLRIGLLLRTDRQKIEAIKRLIQREYSGSYFTACTVSVGVNDRVVVYDFYLSE